MRSNPMNDLSIQNMWESDFKAWEKERLQEESVFAQLSNDDRLKMYETYQKEQLNPYIQSKNKE
ncbi:hypothetical protein PP175_26120 (plasmid) [Aneurinibacillus sp. Ricciae_BoGa-3]|uniref:hypothetical protein n=1 Tax=Aneurinibacillus sp. Ricciae_BoGa-3 TaxID=3022697 RepID=UPI002341C2C0|nr:hypothetical protein [Aneurinibacillus sp. Ricciae_BoGa-3]WCK57544.1 hypothetical protein PP175_26120 [Aneurinibacillus sp. Ricciae_BoGa-3]